MCHWTGWWRWWNTSSCYHAVVESFFAQMLLREAIRTKQLMGIIAGNWRVIMVFISWERTEKKIGSRSSDPHFKELSETAKTFKCPRGKYRKSSSPDDHHHLLQLTSPLPSSQSHNGSLTFITISLFHFTSLPRALLSFLSTVHALLFPHFGED